jgi:PRTRC genetic system protein A
MSDYDPLDFARQNITYHTGKDWPEDYKRVNYILRDNGLWEVRKNPIGTFWVHRYRGNIGGFLKETQKERFELAIPMIPRRLLNQAVAFFRKLSDDHEFEAYVQFVWDIENEEYYIAVPEQRVSQGRVEYDKSSANAKKHVIVCDIHSHNTMEAFFSSTDDKDEKKRGDRFFGVVGRLDLPMPEIKLSYILGGGKRVFVEVDSLFDTVSFPQEWLQRVVYLDREKNQELYGTFSENEEANGISNLDHWETISSDAENWVYGGEV